MTELMAEGTRRIGHAVVEDLAGLRMSVHTCSWKEDELNECLWKWQGMGFCVTGSVCDMVSRDQRIEVMKTVSSIFDGKLNILELENKQFVDYIVSTPI